MLNHKYKNEHKSNCLNKEFWEEVLVGRTIVRLDFEETEIKSFHLDNGEEVHLPEVGRLCIQIDKPKGWPYEVPCETCKRRGGEYCIFCADELDPYKHYEDARIIDANI